MNTFQNRQEMFRFFCDKITNPTLLEIGVFKGDFLNFIIENCKFNHIDAVDLFDGIGCSADVDGNSMIYCDLNENYLNLNKKYEYIENVKIHKFNSIDFLKNQFDNKYDIIYIDGDHSYEGVKNDLINSFHKIKNGGYIMGHDYETNTEKTKNIYDFGVKRAVDEFCIKYKQKILTKALDGCVSFCIKITK